MSDAIQRCAQSQVLWLDQQQHSQDPTAECENQQGECDNCDSDVEDEEDDGDSLN